MRLSVDRLHAFMQRGIAEYCSFPSEAGSIIDKLNHIAFFHFNFALRHARLCIDMGVDRGLLQ